MQAFRVLNGLVAPLDRANVDTDAIIPKQFLKTIDRSGFGANLFDGWRYLEAAPFDQSAGAKWGCFRTAIAGARGTAVGTGRQNTLDMLAACPEADTAAGNMRCLGQQAQLLLRGRL